MKIKFNDLPEQQSQPVTKPMAFVAAFYKDTAEMRRLGHQTSQNGIGKILAGSGIMLVGGSVSVIAAERNSIAFTLGKATWAAGLALTGYGSAECAAGEYTEYAAKTIYDAQDEGAVSVVPITEAVTVM